MHVSLLGVSVHDRTTSGDLTIGLYLTGTQHFHVTANTTSP